VPFDGGEFCLEVVVLLFLVRVAAAEGSEFSPWKMESLIEQVDGFKSLDLFAQAFLVSKTRLELTEEEIKARVEWNKERRNFIAGNKAALLSGGASEVTSVEEFLSSAIIPPCFSATMASKRSKHDEERKRRNYPLTLEQWTAFTLAAFSSTTITTQELLFNPLTKSAQCRLQVANEAQEEVFLHDYIWQPCIDAGLMCNRDNVAKIPGQEPSAISAVIGLPDGVEYAGGDGKTAGRIAAIVEVKSSQNLLLPNQFDQLQNLYKTGVANQRERKSSARSQEWSQVCHPLGQLFAYMVDNNVRFGALCSASKTFFIFFDGKDDSIGTVRITNA